MLALMTSREWVANVRKEQIGIACLRTSPFPHRSTIPSPFGKGDPDPCARQGWTLRYLSSGRPDPRHGPQIKELRLPLPGALMPAPLERACLKPEMPTPPMSSSTTCWAPVAAERRRPPVCRPHDLKEQQLSPIYGDVSSFPPTILLSGTRDLFLSNTALMNQKLFQSSVCAGSYRPQRF
jgi:acetyl esterase/lipase